MKRIAGAVYWEILWKNRVVFPALAVLLGLGTALAWVASHAATGSPWLNPFRTLALMTFLISILVAYAPFTMMESSGGWRMNSMITRWFALPLATPGMVFFPPLVACLFLALLVGVWMPVLNWLGPSLDLGYFLAVLAVGQLAINLLAWTLPRKPMQFWTAVAVLFPFLLLLALVPQDRPHQERFRHAMLLPLSVVGLLLAGFTWLAAARNRCGAWPGELPLDWFWQRLRGGSLRSPRSGFRSPAMALFETEALPNLRLLGFSWVGLVLLLYFYLSLQMRNSRMAELAFSPRLVPLMGMSMLPLLGVAWMAVWGLFTAGEPPLLFRARLSAFRATLPVSAGLLAGQKLAMILFGWALVWLPLAGISFFHTRELTGIPVENLEVMQSGLARFMAAGALVVVGALPLFLWGRFEGLPNFLLSSICVWAWGWGLTGVLKLEPYENPGRLWLLLVSLLALKAMATATGLWLAWRRGQITWRFPLVLITGWLLVTATLVFGLPTWSSGGPWAALRLALLIPLARPAWCPVAIAANRHR